MWRHNSKEMSNSPPSSGGAVHSCTQGQMGSLEAGMQAAAATSLYQQT